MRVEVPRAPLTHPEADGHHSTRLAHDQRCFQRGRFVVDRLLAGEAAIVGATQRPVAELAFSEPNGRPAWKTLPSLAVVATADKAAGTDVVRSMAERAGATITEVDGSHVIMISKPQSVADVILGALAHTNSEPTVIGSGGTKS